MVVEAAGAGQLRHEAEGGERDAGGGSAPQDRCAVVCLGHGVPSCRCHFVHQLGGVYTIRNAHPSNKNLWVPDARRRLLSPGCRVTMAVHVRLNRRSEPHRIVGLVPSGALGDHAPAQRGPAERARPDTERLRGACCCSRGPRTGGCGASTWPRASSSPPRGSRACSTASSAPATSRRTAAPPTGASPTRSSRTPATPSSRTPPLTHLRGVEELFTGRFSDSELEHLASLLGRLPLRGKDCAVDADACGSA